MLFAIVRRGKHTGARLVPHRFEDEKYHVRLTRQGPDIPLADDRDIPEYLANGYSLGMSREGENRRPTVISPTFQPTIAASMLTASQTAGAAEAIRTARSRRTT